jgi:DnaK suppressor protein
MDAKRLEHFKQKLLAELRRHTENAHHNQADALEIAMVDEVKDAADLSFQDVEQEIEYRLSERESSFVSEIEEALRRIEEGRYGICENCGKPISERRLEAMPTARYDADCQALIEAQRGPEETPTL